MSLLNHCQTVRARDLQFYITTRARGGGPAPVTYGGRRNVLLLELLLLPLQLNKLFLFLPLQLYKLLLLL